VEPGQQGRNSHPQRRTPSGIFNNERTLTMSMEIISGKMTTLVPQEATGLRLQSFDDAFRFSKMVASSEFAPKDFRGKPESCMLAIQHGSEVGLSPMQSLQSIAVINGRPTIWGDAALALVQSSPVCEYVREYTEGEGDGLVAVCEAKRRGYPAPTVVRFSVADAKKAGLWGKSGPWSQYSSRMLTLRARGFALRNAFADALRGLITAEEAQDYQTPAPAPEPAREPVVVRPKFDTPPAAAPAANDPVANARLAVQRTNSLELLAALRDRVNQRHREGTFTEAQRNELVHLIDGKCEWLESEPEDNGQEFEHEAAATENQA
jgi:hypothetical protein